MLDEIYMLKKRILQLERLRFGTEFSESVFKNFLSLYGDKMNTLEELQEQLVNFRKNFIEYYIPEEIMDLWDSGDYEVYTDANHHRKMWNEIDNDSSVDFFLAKFFELEGVECNEKDGYNAMMSLYDFCDYCIYFKTTKDLEAFFEKYSVDCCTTFKRNDGYWEEDWSN